MYNAPSGPIRIPVGRNQGSVEARNDRVVDSSAHRVLTKETLAGVEEFAAHQIVHRLANEKPRRQKSGPNNSSR
jgi:hypothetical protein